MELAKWHSKHKAKPIYRWNDGVEAWVSRQRPNSEWPWYLYGTDRDLQN